MPNSSWAFQIISAEERKPSENIGIWSFVRIVCYVLICSRHLRIRNGNANAQTISVAAKPQTQWVIEELILTSHKILSREENPADLFKFLFGESVYAT
jgi:hypothetical protein